ncbi:phosphatidylinositol-specific phospholipase C/glycerophosphodiester phosphodiesterase family protein [Rubripirellula reticaptiva]|nr:phosphatidylinositol-specific phospholipase C/glycerophosphodiester phosphodiesterase family protein [Rubripirellula reticaptiva]
MITLLGCTELNPVGAAETAPSVVPLKQAHAHNDYLHERPLLDALDHGFCSVEADIFLVDGELLVAHSRAELAKSRTLKKLYLDPLSERVKQNGGRVYRGGPVITLLIDFKNEGTATYHALDNLLGEYPDVFSVTKGGERTEKAVNVVISGDRPFATVEADMERFAGLDGRLSDLDSDMPVYLMPMISDRWGSHFKWQGKGEMTTEEKQKLDTIVKQAHAKGRILRFWAIPDNPTSWKALQEAGVDLINTDNLDGLSKTLKE